MARRKKEYAPREKKPWYKRWWVWVLASPLLLGMLGAIISPGGSSEDTTGGSRGFGGKAGTVVSMTSPTPSDAAIDRAFLDFDAPLETDPPAAAPEEPPEGTPEPTPQPARQPAPERIAEPTAEPELTPDPTAEPAAEPELTPEPIAEPTAEPTPEPVPDPTAEPAPEPSPELVLLDYVLNKNTMKFHKPGCSSVKDIKDENREDVHAAREDLIARGYSPCGVCHP